jgi:hypothetical protein
MKHKHKVGKKKESKKEATFLFVPIYGIVTPRISVEMVKI